MHTDRSGVGRHHKLGVTFAPLVRPAVGDVNLFERGRVGQHLETRDLGAAFLIVSRDGLLPDHRRFARFETHAVLRPNIDQPFRIERQRNCDVLLVQFFDSRQICGMRASLSDVCIGASGEKADAEARDKHNNGERSVPRRASLASALGTPGERLSTANRKSTGKSACATEIQKSWQVRFQESGGVHRPATASGTHRTRTPETGDALRGCYLALTGINLAASKRSKLRLRA